MKRKSRKFGVKCVNLSKYRSKNNFFAFFLLLVILTISYIRYLGTPIVIANTETQIGNHATTSINQTSADTMNQNVSYGDLVTV